MLYQGLNSTIHSTSQGRPGHPIPLRDSIHRGPACSGETSTGIER